MRFFNILTTLFRKVFRLEASVHTEVPESFPNQMPAFVPIAPSPLRVENDHSTKKKFQGSLRYHHVGPITVIYCGNRHRFREVTRAIDKIANAQRAGIDHRRKVLERKIIVLQQDLHIINRAMSGASYHELRAAA